MNWYLVSTLCYQIIKNFDGLKSRAGTNPHHIGQYKEVGKLVWNCKALGKMESFYVDSLAFSLSVRLEKYIGVLGSSV